MAMTWQAGSTHPGTHSSSEFSSSWSLGRASASLSWFLQLSLQLPKRRSSCWVSWGAWLASLWNGNGRVLTWNIHGLCVVLVFATSKVWGTGRRNGLLMGVVAVHRIRRTLISNENSNSVSVSLLSTSTSNEPKCFLTTWTLWSGTRNYTRSLIGLSSKCSVLCSFFVPTLPIRPVLTDYEPVSTVTS